MVPRWYVWATLALCWTFMMTLLLITTEVWGRKGQSCFPNETCNASLQCVPKRYYGHGICVNARSFK